MRHRKGLRAFWARRTLAAKLTLSYTAALSAVAVGVVAVSGTVVALELRRAGARAAEAAAESVAMAIDETILVAADPEDQLVRPVPDEMVHRLLESSSHGSVLASALLLEDGKVLSHSRRWPEWSGAAVPLVETEATGSSVAARVLGRRAHHVAYAHLPVFDATAAVIYDASYLEAFLGRLLIVLGCGAVLTIMSLLVVSRVTANFITAPVRRAAGHLLDTTGQGDNEAAAGDELSGLVRRLLHISVKLDYERRHRAIAEDELAISSTVFSESSEGIVILDPDGTINRVNPAFANIVGMSAEDLWGRSISVLAPSAEDQNNAGDIQKALETNGEWAGEIDLTKPTGELVPVLLAVRGVSDSQGGVRHYIGVARDISDIRATKDRLEHLATHDSLTDLSNRTYLSEALEHVIESRRRRGGKAAVLFLDVDHFKDVNDAHGHHTGDKLLQLLASRLRETIRGEDFISRFGGDEFVVVITEFEVDSTVDEIVRRMLNRVREPARIGGITIRPSATAGIAVWPESGQNPEDLLKNADAAMYESKRIGRGGYRYHSAETNESVRVRLAVRDRVRFALRTGELTLLWQPVVRTEDSGIVGAEALVRLRKNGELVAPSSFMPQIEGSEVMVELARWVLDSTAKTIRTLHASLPEEFHVAVNVSATEILQRDFVPLVLETLESHSVPTSRLAVEVTEGAAIRDIPLAQSVIRGLRRHGVRVYLDDFGVGYSSLQYLRELGVDAVKLDKSFLDEVPGSPASCSLVRGVVEMAHGLGLVTTVEGVEREDQLEYLKSINCDRVQGYYTGVPMEAEEVTALLFDGSSAEARET